MSRNAFCECMKGCVKARLDSDLLATCCFRRFLYSMFRDSNVIDKGINKKKNAPLQAGEARVKIRIN